MASKRRLRRRACINKISYDTEAEAIAMAIRQRKWSPGHQIYQYKCPFAGHWHTGHRPAKVWQAINASRAAH